MGDLLRKSAVADHDGTTAWDRTLGRRAQHLLFGAAAPINPHADRGPSSLALDVFYPSFYSNPMDLELQNGAALEARANGYRSGFSHAEESDVSDDNFSSAVAVCVFFFFFFLVNFKAVNVWNVVVIALFSFCFNMGFTSYNRYILFDFFFLIFFL